MSIVEKLVENKTINAALGEKIKKEIADTNESEEKILLKHGVSFENILKVKNGGSGIPQAKLAKFEIPLNILKHIPENTATHYKIVPLQMNRGVLEIGMVDPTDIDARDIITFLTSKENLPFKIFELKEADFKKILESYKGISGEVKEALTELDDELSQEEAKIVESLNKEEKSESETKVIEEAPVTKIVATILHYAVGGDASDIHIEPMDKNIRVRFRVDGILNTSLILPLKVHQAVVARIKILSNIRLDEKRKPQDGRFSAKIEGRKVDFRVSTFPSYYGEKIVMRILDTAKGVKRLGEMGLTKRNFELIKSAIRRPYGLILISGPTGSGKTTTLYSMLNELDRERQNVLSLEDPVEYSVGGVNQSQVRPEIGYSFANGLRTTLRQDPDIIMVGEIRDKETAQLAVQAALTGHLVLSTIHTNNAIGVIPRLIDMGVDPFLIAPTLILAIAQRLVKTLCPEGGKPIPVEGSIKMMIENVIAGVPEEYKKPLISGKNVFEAKSTPDCPKGVRGRMGIFEVLEMNKDVERVVLSGGNELKLKEVARKQGMLFMKEDAIIKAYEAKIPFEEVNKL